ncbi:hypothetical protein STPL106120_04200 [Streptococcus pluranimalium]
MKYLNINDNIGILIIFASAIVGLIIGVTLGLVSIN